MIGSAPDRCCIGSRSQSQNTMTISGCWMQQPCTLFLFPSSNATHTKAHTKWRGGCAQPVGTPADVIVPTTHVPCFAPRTKHFLHSHQGGALFSSPEWRHIAKSLCEAWIPQLRTEGMPRWQAMDGANQAPRLEMEKRPCQHPSVVQRDEGSTTCTPREAQEAHRTGDRRRDGGWRIWAGWAIEPLPLAISAPPGSIASAR